MKKCMTLRSILTGAAIVALTACGSSTADGQPKGKATIALPAQQKQYCQILEHGYAEYKRLEGAAATTMGTLPRVLMIRLAVPI